MGERKGWGRRDEKERERLDNLIRRKISISVTIRTSRYAYNNFIRVSVTRQLIRVTMIETINFQLVQSADYTLIVALLINHRIQG